MDEYFICRIPTLEEIAKKQDYELEHSTPEGKENWKIWKEKAIENARSGKNIPYYGFLGDEIICEATAIIDPEQAQNSENLVDQTTVYLSAFRTIPEYQGKGYFSKLFKFMIEDLKKRGYKKATLGVEPQEIKNKSIYAHYGFDELVKIGEEIYPDGTRIDVEYYSKNL